MTNNFDRAESAKQDAADKLSRTILHETAEWQRLASLPYEEVLDVYIDLKSPHAYLAIRPSLEVAKDYRVKVNFCPYTLSYESLGLTTHVGQDKQRRPPSAAADRKARMYYAAAREYAALQGLPFRTPHRLLDSHLAHKVMLYAKKQTLEIPFIMQVYLQGWGSGWRRYELESLDQLSQSLTEVGGEIDQLENYVGTTGAGETDLKSAMADAEHSGCAGAPHFVFSSFANRQRVGLFGREHLSLIRGKYAAAGLARDNQVTAEFSHAWRGPVLS